MLSGAMEELLQRLPDGLLVLDRERNLRFVNDRARQLLGYHDGDHVGGRCRMTTRGVDCEAACPLSFALERRLDRVEEFETVYRGRNGRAVRLAVTLLPLRDQQGEFMGALEILRQLDPDPGFYLAGDSPTARSLCERARFLAASGCHVLVLGEPVARIDVARAVHRMSGLDGGLFRLWPGAWREVEPWPPGTMYVEGPGARLALGVEPPEGWRVIVGAANAGELLESSLTLEVFELPPLEQRVEDLQVMVAAWIRQLAPGLAVDAEVLLRLARIGRDAGLERLSEIVVAAVAAARDSLCVHHLPVDGYGAGLVDDLLRSSSPLLAAEVMLIREVLDRCGWRVQEAADRLGVSRVTLWRKMRDHGIERCSGQGGAHSSSAEAPAAVNR